MEEDEANSSSGRRLKKLLLILNCIILSVGTSGGPLIMRLYFLHGGSRVWLSSWLETGGWPLIFIPLVISYIYRRRHHKAGSRGSEKMVQMKPFVFVASAVIGVLTGLDDYLYAYGVARLPVSTSALIIASQLAFTAAFAFLLVKQRFTSYSVNAIFLLTLGAGVLALHTGSDKPKGESNREYMLGFVMTIGAAALYGLILPMVELTYKKAKQVITYTLVLEIQLVMCFFATLFCTIGMLINHDFQAIGREARESDIGEVKYYMVLVWSGIIWQFFFLGAIGVIFCSSSLFSGIVIAVLLPLTEILAVFFFKEKFTAEKGVSLALSLWGFLSYFYGEFKLSHKPKPPQQQDNQQQQQLSTIMPA